MRPVVAMAGALGLTLFALAACSSQPPTVSVTVGSQTEQLVATQYCLGGKPAFNQAARRPPVLRVSPNEPIVITVPKPVAQAGWQIQVFDSSLQNEIGQVDAGRATTYDQLSTSDAVPPEFYLVIVQNAGSGCEGLSGAWPIGMVRGAEPGQPAPTSTPAGPTSPGAASPSPTSAGSAPSGTGSGTTGAVPSGSTPTGSFPAGSTPSGPGTGGAPPPGSPTGCRLRPRGRRRPPAARRRPCGPPGGPGSGRGAASRRSRRAA